MPGRIEIAEQNVYLQEQKQEACQKWQQSVSGQPRTNPQTELDVPATTGMLFLELDAV